MAQQFKSIEPIHQEFLQRQHVFFNASAAADGRVNVSPRNTSAFRVINPNTVAYLDLTGSGNETAAHLKADGRLTLMFCAFEGPPTILRLYGHGRILRRGSPEYLRLLESAFANEEPIGIRQMVRLDIDLVQTSCGYAVPLFEYASDRTTLDKWAASKGDNGLDAYRREKNTTSMDGFPTGLFDVDEA